MSIRPLYDQVLVERSVAAEVSVGGIFIPQTVQEKSTEAVVVAVGKGRLLDSGIVVSLDVKVGDKVLLAKHAFTEVKVDGKDLIIIREDAILAVFE